ncbi:MAG: MBL fold metallo-hydrolase [Brevinematales bacterium]
MKNNFIFSVLPSVRRDNPPMCFKLPSGLTLTPAGAIKISGLFKSEFIPSGFKIESNGRMIYIDPFVINDPVPADYIFITHAHPDHLSLEDIKKIAKKGTVIICPHCAVKKLSKFYMVIEIRPGEVFDLGDIKCEAVPAYNIKPGFLWFHLHPKADKNTGYIINIDGSRIFHAGDTDNIPEIRNLKDISVALVPIGAGNTAMNPEQAAALINEMRPLSVIPMHYETGRNAARDFKNLVDKSVEVMILQGGE